MSTTPMKHDGRLRSIARALIGDAEALMRELEIQPAVESLKHAVRRDCQRARELLRNPHTRHGETFREMA